MRSIGCLIVPLLLAPAPAAGQEAPRWTVDKAHSRVEFTVTHFFTPVTGAFETFDVLLAYDPADPARSRVEAVIVVASVTTSNDRRDAHLRTADFFDAATHPTITFRSTAVRPAGDGALIVTGPLTIRGTTRMVELRVAILGTTFTTELTIDRRDFGVGVGDWAATLVVGKEVDIAIAVEARR